MNEADVPADVVRHGERGVDDAAGRRVVNVKNIVSATASTGAHITNGNQWGESGAGFP